MDSIQARAEKIVFGLPPHLNREEKLNAIASEIQAAGDERVNEVLNNTPKNIAFARDEGLEDAAVVVETYHGTHFGACRCGQIANLIRALKSQS